MNRRKTRILLQSVSPGLSTGYGRVSQYLFEGLKNSDELEFWQLGMQSLGPQKDPHLLPIGGDPSGKEILPKYIKDLNIDVLVTIVDNWIPEFEYLAEVVKETGVRWLCHVTCNTIPLPFATYNAIKTADYYVAPSNFVKEQLNNVNFNNVLTIYHGTNTELFKPMEVKKNEKFTFLSVGTNKFYQKNWMGLLRAMNYLVYTLGVKDVKLVILTELNLADGVNFPLALKNAGLQEYLTFIPVLRDIGLPEKEMAKVYNMADCFVTASHGESFGLPILESMACGVPVIAPDFSAMKELVENSGAGLTAELRDLYPVFCIAEQAWVDYIDLAKKMKFMMDNPELRKEMGKKGVEFAKEYEWKNIIPQWIKIIREVDKPLLNLERGEIGI